MGLKKIIKYIPRIIPGVGLGSLIVREYKKRKGTLFPYYNLRKKEDRITLGKYALQIGYLGFFLIKASFTYKGTQTLINRIKESRNIEQVENKEDNKLEKTVYFNDILDKNPSRTNF